MTLPLTILGGYLGAGKTTLINQLLSGTHGKRLTVLVNDFGAVNIDAGLIAEHNGDTISLANGCACCQLQDDALKQ
ncbi:MAG: GTP-binding protein, partial [Parvibaculales bacterium]